MDGTYMNRTCTQRIRAQTACTYEYTILQQIRTKRRISTYIRLHAYNIARVRVGRYIYMFDHKYSVFRSLNSIQTALGCVSWKTLFIDDRYQFFGMRCMQRNKLIHIQVLCTTRINGRIAMKFVKFIKMLFIFRLKNHSNVFWEAAPQIQSK